MLLTLTIFPVLLATQATAPVSYGPSPPETVAEFLTQAEALAATVDAGGEASAQADAIRAALQQAAMAYRTSLAEAATRGDKPPSCPPPPGQAQLSLDDITGDFRAFPQANRDMPVVTAFALVMTLRYPCGR